MDANDLRKEAYSALNAWEKKLLELDISKYDDQKKLIQDLQDEIRRASLIWNDYLVLRDGGDENMIKRDEDMKNVLKHPQLFGVDEKGSDGRISERGIWEVLKDYLVMEKRSAQDSRTDESGQKQEGIGKENPVVNAEVISFRLEAEEIMGSLRGFADRMIGGKLKTDEEQLRDMRLKYMDQIWIPMYKKFGGEAEEVVAIKEVVAKKDALKDQRKSLEEALKRALDALEEVRRSEQQVILHHNSFLPNLFRPELEENDTTSLWKQFDALKNAFKQYFDARENLLMRSIRKYDRK